MKHFPPVTCSCSGRSLPARSVIHFQAASLHGNLKVFVDKRRFSGNPRNVVLKPHELITIEEGRTVTPPPYTFAPGL